MEIKIRGNTAALLLLNLYCHGKIFKLNLDTEKQLIMQHNMQNQAAQQQNQQYVENVKSQLVNTFDYAPDAAEDFIQRYSDPTSVTLDNLVTLDKIKSAPPEEVLKNQRKAEKMRRQKEKAKMPEPVAVQPAESAQDPDVEDKLMDAMVTDYERQNPWT